MKPGLFLLLLLLMGETYADNCLKLTGVVHDYATRKPLEATFFLKTPGGRVRVGQSEGGTGRFSLVVNCQATALLVERTGYRPQHLPLMAGITGDRATPTGVFIPLVAVNQRATDKAYEQSEQRHYEQQAGTPNGQRPQRGVFVVSDALTGTPLLVKACLFSTTGEPKRCFDTNSQGQFEAGFSQRDIVAVEIQKPGYQSYQGNIAVEQLDGQVRRHEIKLVRELTLAVVRLAQTRKASRCELRGNGMATAVQLMPVPGAEGQFCTYTLLPGSYELALSDATGAVWHRRAVVVQAGLNVFSVPERIASGTAVASPSEKQELVKASSVGPRRVYRLPDELPLLYFDQGSYLLDDDDRDMLRQVGAFMKAHPEYKLKLIGHTDPEGDERMNRYLAEFRTKIIANYLFWEGISPDRLSLSGQGSRYPVSPSDSEDNKAKNRRVFLKLERNE